MTDNKTCNVDILSVSLGEEGYLIIPRQTRELCEPLDHQQIIVKNSMEANVAKPQLIMRQLDMFTDVRAKHLAGVVIANAELPGEIGGNGFYISINCDFHIF